jgi:hypothetical protein
MATWAELERADPDLALFGRQRFEGRVVFHATLMADGAPRLHPVSPWFATGLLLVSFRAKSPKVEEIMRDGRYAMHSAQPAEDHEGEAGEFLVRGWMEQLSEEHPGVVQRPYTASYLLASFACSIEEAVSTTYPGGGSPVYRRCRP